MSSIRVNGKVVVENENVKMGAHHCIEIEMHRNVTVLKEEWNHVLLDRVGACCGVDRAEIAIVLMQEGLANICSMTDYMTLVKQRVDVSISKKQMGSTSQYEKSMKRFHDQLLQAILRTIDFEVVKVVILASPGFVKDEFWTFAKESPLIKQHSSKFILTHSASGHKQALDQVLSSVQLQSRLSTTKYAQEVKLMNNFMHFLNVDDGRAIYGYDDVVHALDVGCIQHLLLSDHLFRSNNVEERKKYDRLATQCRQSPQAHVHIFSSMHTSGEQLAQITGVAAILKYSIPKT